MTDSRLDELIAWAHKATETIQELAARVEELERERVPAKTRITSYLRFFHPMRFTVNDVAEELGMSVKSAGVYLGELAAAGTVSRVADPESPGRFLYFAGELERAA